jgi:tetratricopeptide (TPR) repeat protein
VEWYPDDYKAYFKLGRIHYQEQRYEDAELSFLQASQLNPKSAEAKNNLAVSQAHLGKFREAYKNLESASTLQRGSFVNQAYVYAQLGKFNEALEKAPHTASNNRAVCQLVLGQPYEALETLEKVAAPSALTLYLHAIAATYLNDIGLMCQKLGECISMDAAFRDKARKEAEFNPYRQNEQFRSALKLPSGLQPSQN